MTAAAATTGKFSLSCEDVAQSAPEQKVLLLLLLLQPLLLRDPVMANFA